MKKILAVILTIIISINGITVAFAANDERMTGDIDGNGNIEISDTTFIQKHLANLIHLDETALTCADVDRNNRVNIHDASLIQKYALNLIDDFPVNTTEPTTESMTTQPAEKETVESTETSTTVKPTEEAKPTIETTEPTTIVTEPTTKPITVTPTDLEMEIFNMVNDVRVRCGEKPLKFGYFYYEAAKIRAVETDTCWGHTRPDGSSCITAIDEIGISTEHRYAGENVAKYYNDAQKVMKDWLNSPGHATNILRSNYDYIAIATYESKEYPGYYTIVQLFLSDEEFILTPD